MEALQTNTRISLSNILVTTDFSQTSKNALPFAAALARQYEAKIIVAHVVSPELHMSVPLDPLPAEADPTFLEAQGKLAEFSLGNSLGVRPAKMLLKRGDVWSVISDIIQKNKIDLVVTGTHGRQGTEEVGAGIGGGEDLQESNLPRADCRPPGRPAERHELEARNHSFPDRWVRDFTESSSVRAFSGGRESGQFDLLAADAYDSRRVSGVRRSQCAGSDAASGASRGCGLV